MQKLTVIANRSVGLRDGVKPAYSEGVRSPSDRQAGNPVKSNTVLRTDDPIGRASSSLTFLPIPRNELCLFVVLRRNIRLFEEYEV